MNSFGMFRLSRLGDAGITLMFVLCASLADAQQKRDLSPFYSLSDPRFDSIVLATVGPWSITAQEFLLNYEFGPAFPKRVKDSKNRYLTYIVYEKLLALDGYTRGVQSSPMVKEMLDEIEGDLATEELYRDDVLSNVTVGQEEIAAGVAKERVHIVLKWLYTTQKEEIDRANASLSVGASFDSLFAMQLSDSVKADERSMETTRFKLQIKNPVLAGTTDTLRFGQHSSPMRGPDGWYILKLADGWTDPLLTETEAGKLRNEVNRSLVQQRSDSLSDAYVHQMMLEQNPVIVKDMFELLQTDIGKKVLSRDKFERWIGRRLDSPPDSSTLKAAGKKVLVRLKDGSFSLDDFLSWYKTRELYVQLRLTSQRSFLLSLEQLIWRMVRDRLLTQRAFARSLQNRESVKKQKQWWEEKLVYLAEKGRLVDAINTRDTTLLRYYEEHTRDYRDDKGNPKSFEEVRDDVLRDYSSFELTRTLLHRILQLKQSYKVDIREEALEKLYVDTENNPRAIDVYTVKKGGIFPHTAFPFIDYDWQRWE